MKNLNIRFKRKQDRMTECRKDMEEISKILQKWRKYFKKYKEK